MGAVTPPRNGFTLIELVVVIALAGIIASVIAGLIARPIQGYADVTRRAALVDAADSALQRMARDVRRALPNSIRIRCNGAAPPCGGAETLWALEMLDAHNGGRYREGPGPGAAAPECRLDFNSPAGDSEWAVAGGLGTGDTSGAVVIANWSATGPAANAYAGDNRTPSGTTVTVTSAPAVCNGEPRLQLSSPFRFPFRSERQRLFLVDTPITYLCDSAGATLRRYAGYTIQADQGDVDSHGELLGAGAAPALVADKIGGCRITYQPGTSQRAGLVTMELRISDGSEQVRLLHQVHVENVP